MNGTLFERMSPPFRHPERMGRAIVAQTILLSVGAVVLVIFWGQGDRFDKVLFLLTLLDMLIRQIRGVEFWWQYRKVEVRLRPVRFHWWD
jgi:hypothetical protein